MSDELQERASRAFTPEFRAKLADACMLEERPILPATLVINCMPACCPLGAYDDRFGEFAEYDRMAQTYSYSFIEGGLEFARAFDHGEDDGTPEAALGLLYRRRFVK